MFGVVSLRRASCAAILGVFTFVSASNAQTGEQVRIGGTGAALAAMRMAGERLAAIEPGFRAEVLPSLGTPGSKRALMDGAIQIAAVLAIDPLKPQEIAAGLSEAACFTTAMILATSHRKPGGLRRAELPAVYAAPAPAWPDGKPLKVVLRSRAGSENPYFARAVPGMGPALDMAYGRPGMPIAATDQENADLAMMIPGSFVMMTLLQLKTERLSLQPLDIDGTRPSVETLASGAYPFPVRLCLVVRGDSGPGTGRFVAFLRSSEGAAFLKAHGANPAN